MLRVAYETLHDELLRVLLDYRFSRERADLCARLFADASRDGVHSHGLNRFPRFIEQIRHGVVDVQAEAEGVETHESWERWHGRFGPGNLNAHACMERAIALAHEHGMGAVALGYTNHWMRGGSYGWQAAEAGVIGLCWTNTMPNLPPWGATDCRIGNNPLVIAVPRRDGHVVLDMAISQFSYGALESYRKEGRKLPADGGYDVDGELTRDPAAIEESGRPLPVGLWKGSGLAVVLDVIAAALSRGLATHQIEPDPVKERGVSQVFITISVSGSTDAIADAVVRSLRGAEESVAEVRYPGEQTLARRRESLQRGVPVDPAIWDQVRNM